MLALAGKTQRHVHTILAMQHLQAHLVLAQNGIEIHGDDVLCLYGRKLPGKWAAVGEPTGGEIPARLGARGKIGEEQWLVF